MTTNPSPTIRQRRLARVLRDLRVQAGLKHADVTQVLDCAESKVTRIENALSGVRTLDLRALLDAYGLTDQTKRAELEALARKASQRGWWTRYANAVDSAYTAYMAVEWDAATLYDVETSLVPGLLQTPEYTEAVIRGQNPHYPDDAIQTQVHVRTERRKVLARETPLQLWVILAESLLYHQIGAHGVMSRQLRALMDASEQPHVELQVLPRESPLNGCLYGPFVIMSFPGMYESDIVYTDSSTSTVYFEEPSDIEAYTTVFRRLSAAAASVDDSRKIIATALQEMA